MNLLGWRRDQPDFRDKIAEIPLMIERLPSVVNLRPKCPPIYDQKSLGSCTAQAVGAVFQFTEMEQRKAMTDIPSRLFIYYNTRLIEGTVSIDSGASLRNAIKSLARYGACREVDWPYKVSKYRIKPFKDIYDRAIVKQLKSYQRVPQQLYDLKMQLAHDNPIVFGFSVYDSFMSGAVEKIGIMEMPAPGESMLGGHAVTLVGYDDDHQAFLVRNSWGAKWGIKGYFYMPYKYVLDPNLSADFWTITAVN